MSADSIKAGGAVVTVGADTNPLSKAIEAAKSKIEKFGASISNIGSNIGLAAGVIGGIGAAITAPFAAGLAVLVDAAGPISSVARRTGMSLSEVQDVAAGFRISMEDLPSVIGKMSSAIVDARNPASQMARDFAELGLNIADLDGVGPAEQLAMIGSALNNVSDNARRMDLTRGILGRQGLGANFSGGAEGIQSRIDRNRELGGFIDPADIRAAQDYAKAQAELKIATLGISRVLGAVFAPAAQWIAEKVLSVVMTVREWIDNNRALLAIAVRVGVGLGMIASVIGTVAAAFVGGGAALGFLTPVFAAIATGAKFIAAGFVLMLPYLLALAGAAMTAWTVMEIFQVSLSDIWEAIKAVWRSIVDAVDWVSVLTAVLSPLIVYFGLAAGAVYLLWTAIDSIDWARIAEAIRGAFRLAVDYVVYAARAIYGAVSYVFDWLVAAFPRIFGFIGSAIGAVVDGVMGWFSILRTFVSNGIDNLVAIFGDLTTAFGAIGDAINAGDWASAFSIAMTAIQLIWERTKIWLLDSWYSLSYKMGLAWDSLVNTFGPTLGTAMKTIINVFYGLVSGIEGAINSVVDGVNAAIELLPEIARPETLNRLNLGSGGREAALAAVDGALTPSGTPRVQQTADRARLDELEAQLEQERADAASAAANAAWLANEERGARPGGAAAVAALTYGSGMGSFSAAALGGIGASSAAERTATAVEAMVGPVRRTADALEGDEGGVVAS